MDTHRKNEVTLLFGKKGGGKSTLARKLAKRYARRVYLDPMFEVRDAVIATSFHDLALYVGARGTGSFSVALRTLDMHEELRTVELLTHGDPERPLFPGTLIVLEEMDRLCSPNSLPPGMQRLANYARHFGVSIIGVARSPKRIHPDFRRAADVIYVGAMNEPADVDYLNEYVGNDFCDRARALQGYDFLRWPQLDAP